MMPTRATNDPITSPTRAWIKLLRANCLTLVHQPAVARAVSVSRGFPAGAEEERAAVMVLAHRMAEEYGLSSEIEQYGHSLTVRFSHKEEPLVAGESPRRATLFKRVGAWLGGKQ